MADYGTVSDEIKYSQVNHLITLAHMAKIFPKMDLEEAIYKYIHSEAMKYILEDILDSSRLDAL